MNKILNLFDQAYVNNLFKEKILPLYPDYAEIKEIKISPVKKNVWTTTYHVVIEFSALFSNSRGALLNVPVYFTAHSSEPRKNSYSALLYLWQSGFSEGDLIAPRPLFFSDYFNGYFYHGISGRCLYDYINDRNYQEIEKIVARAAAWLAKLHRTPVSIDCNFNPANSRVLTVVPGVDKILSKINRLYPDSTQSYKNIYKLIMRKEAEYFSSASRQYLIHGDAHPQNVIKIDEKKIAIIDFTDICLGDFARDLGSFLQQLEYMALKKITDLSFVEKIKKIFIDNYFGLAKITMNEGLKSRIANYYNWTALRTATFFMLKENPEPERSYVLLEKISANLNINSKL